MNCVPNFDKVRKRETNFITWGLSPSELCSNGFLLPGLIPLDLESLFEGSSSRGQLFVYPQLKNGPLLGKIILFDCVCTFRRNTHREVREKGDAHLVSQTSPGAQ